MRRGKGEDGNTHNEKRARRGQGKWQEERLEREAV